MDTYDPNFQEDDTLFSSQEVTDSVQASAGESVSQEPPQAPAPEQSPPPRPRKPSPYANSPYEIHAPSQEQEYVYHPQTRPPEKPPKAPRQRSGGFRSVLLTVVLVAAGCLITALAVNQRWENRTASLSESMAAQIDSLQKQIEAQNQTPAISTAPQKIPADGSAMTPSQLYAACVDSVVAISSTVQTSGYYGSSEDVSSGSGFIYSEDGYVITNYHVVEDAASVDVVMYDGTEYPAEIVGYDSTNDIAVLKVDAQGLPAASLGQSGALSIGDMVVAIGNPLGQLAATQTVGYVSGINREVATDSTIISMIQTDAAINPGNSGGPLFNMYGQVIGITSAKYSGTTGSGASIEGIGFAIPMDDVTPIISDLISYGYVTGAYMGVTVQNTDAESAAMFGLPTGAYVLEVVEGGSAQRAGIQVKDIIIDLGGTTITNVTDLTRALRKFQAGDNTTVTVIRSGKEVTMDITLDEKPQELPEETAPQPEYGYEGDDPFDDWFSWYFGG